MWPRDVTEEEGKLLRFLGLVLLIRRSSKPHRMDRYGLSPSVRVLNTVTVKGTMEGGVRATMPMVDIRRVALLNQRRGPLTIITLTRESLAVVQHHQKMTSTHLVEHPSYLTKRKPNIGLLVDASTVARKDT